MVKQYFKNGSKYAQDTIFFEYANNRLTKKLEDQGKTITSYSYVSEHFFTGEKTVYLRTGSSFGHEVTYVVFSKELVHKKNKNYQNEAVTSETNTKSYYNNEGNITKFEIIVLNLSNGISRRDCVLYIGKIIYNYANSYYDGTKTVNLGSKLLLMSKDSVVQLDPDTKETYNVSYTYNDDFTNVESSPWNIINVRFSKVYDIKYQLPTPRKEDKYFLKGIETRLQTDFKDLSKYDYCSGATPVEGKLYIGRHHTYEYSADAQRNLELLTETFNFL